MLTWLADLPHLPGVFHLFRYLTFRTLGAAGTGLFLVLFFGPSDHFRASPEAGQGTADTR